MEDNSSEMQEESMIVRSTLMGHVSGPVTWGEVAVLARSPL